MDERRAVNMRATFGFSSHWTSTTTGSDLRASATRRWRCVAAAATRSTQARWSRCHQRRQCRGAHARAWRPLPPPPPWPQRAGRRGPHGRRNETTKGLERRDLLCFRLRARQWRSSAPRSRPRASAAGQSRSSGAPRSSHAFGTTLIEDVQQSAFRPSGEHCSRRRNEAQEVPGSSAVPGLAFFLDTWHQLLKPTHGAHHWDL